MALENNTYSYIVKQYLFLRKRFWIQSMDDRNSDPK